MADVRTLETAVVAVVNELEQKSEIRFWTQKTREGHLRINANLAIDGTLTVKEINEVIPGLIELVKKVQSICSKISKDTQKSIKDAEYLVNLTTNEPA